MRKRVFAILSAIMAIGLVATAGTSLPYSETFLNSSDRASLNGWTALSHGKVVEDGSSVNKKWAVSRDKDEDGNYYGYIQMAMNTKAYINSIASPAFDLKGGQKYVLEFDLTNYSSNSNGLTGDYYPADIDIYLSTAADYSDDDELQAMPNLFSKHDMLAVAKYGWEPQKVSFTPEADGTYYLIIRGKRGNLNVVCLAVKSVSLYEGYDNNLTLNGFTSPAETAQMYSEAETVTISVTNNGSNDAEDAVAVLYVDGVKVASEAMAVIPAGADAEHTFAFKADLSEGINHTLRAEIIWANDGFASDNTAEHTTTSLVASPPWATDSYDPNFADNWTVVDLNSDGATFAVEQAISNYALWYRPAEENANTDEMLYSRPFNLRGGNKYVVVSRAWTESAAGDDGYQGTFGLYTLGADGTYTQVGENFDEKDYPGESVTDYHRGTFDVATDGVYVIGFHLTKATPSAYYFRFNEFSIARTADVDLKATSVRMPGKMISAFTQLPLGMYVENNGVQDISSLTLRVSADGFTAPDCQLTFDEPLTPGSKKLVWWDNDVEFSSLPAGRSDLKFEAIAEGDGLESNNCIYVAVEKVPSLDLPASIKCNTTSGWLALNYDRDYYNWSCMDQYYEQWYITPSLDEVPDGLASRSFNLQAGPTYMVSFKALATYLDADIEAENIYLVNCSDYSRISLTPIITSDNVKTSESYALSFTVPTDGEYSFYVEDAPFSYSGYYCTLGIDEAVNVSQADGASDLNLTALEYTATESGIYDEPVDVTLSFKNDGANTLQGVVFTLQVADKTYRAVYREAIPAGSEDTYSIIFPAVDIVAPASYTLTASVNLTGDATPDNNVISVALDSKPRVDVALVSLSSPRSGELGREEKVTVNVANNGKGAITLLPMKLTVTQADADEPMAEVTEEFTTNIADGETAALTFETTLDLSAIATYRITVESTIADDINTENNVIATNVVCTHESMDAGVVAIDGPTGTDFTAEEYLVVKVRNYGTTALYDVPLTATVTDAEGATVGTVSGVLADVAADETVVYTFPVAVDLSKGGDFNVTAATAIDADINKDNDSCAGTIHGLLTDCGVTEIIAPAEDCYEGERAITIRITNLGDKDVTDVPVRFQTGAMPQSETYNGTIQPGESVEYTFNTPYNFRSGRQYELVCYTELEGDMRPANDAYSVTIIPVVDPSVYTPLAGDVQLDIPNLSGRYDSGYFSLAFYSDNMLDSDNFVAAAGHLFNAEMRVWKLDGHARYDQLPGVYTVKPMEEGPFVAYDLVGGAWYPFAKDCYVAMGTALTISDDEGYVERVGLAASGTITVTEVSHDEAIYRFDIDITTPEGHHVTGNWEGKAEDFIQDWGDDASESEYEGIEGVNVDADFAVDGRTLILSSAAEVFNPQGMLVASGSNLRLNLAPGIYVIRTSEGTRSICIR